MKPLRKLQLWLADKDPAFDKPGVYRRTVVQGHDEQSRWDAVLMAMVSLVLVFTGLGGLLLALFLLSVIVATWFG